MSLTLLFPVPRGNVRCWNALRLISKDWLIYLCRLERHRRTPPITCKYCSRIIGERVHSAVRSNREATAYQREQRDHRMQRSAPHLWKRSSLPQLRRQHVQVRLPARLVPADHGLEMPKSPNRSDPNIPIRFHRVDRARRLLPSRIRAFKY